jgi:hypothetical protein
MMESRQVQLFRQITLDYFAKLAPADPPTLEAPFLQFGEPALLDYASLVRVRGAYDGCVYLTSPRRLLRELLAIHGEGEVSERTLEDMCRELSNVLSGNASEAFGGDWEISVPASLGPQELSALSLPGSAFVMPFRWRGEGGMLVIGLEPRREAVA